MGLGRDVRRSECMELGRDMVEGQVNNEPTYSEGVDRTVC